MRIYKPSQFTADDAWKAIDIERIGDATVRLHWTDQPYVWHINDGPEVFVVLNGSVDMHARAGGIEQIDRLEIGDIFHAESGDEHVAHPKRHRPRLGDRACRKSIIQFGKGSKMLKLKPSCEHCDKDLPANARDAMICSFECTFCSECVHTHFENVCPNCGGGFQPRPVRPSQPHKGKAHLGANPASTERVHNPKDLEAVREFNNDLKKVDPYFR